jgi:hypothetical protein
MPHPWNACGRAGTSDGARYEQSGTTLGLEREDPQHERCRDAGRLRVCGLEQLDGVAGGVLEENLLASWTADDLVPEGDAGRT